MELNLQALQEHPEACENYVKSLPLAERGKIFRDVRAERLAVDKTAALLKKFETFISDSIIREVPAGEGFVSDGYSYVVTTKETPVIRDLDAILGYISETGRFDILQKSISAKAVMNTENWHTIPGIGRFNVVKLSVTKK